ncbi:DNA adenine methylase [Mucilaginibacter sp. SG538B]|uniref:DNA adenine methylase n=1 Tax=Mucilaginibacter sp. SG538B TaxID=2587021 RepID=UPI00159E13B6|nr:Dam family site-specific DNA-(adenine-N6)-methyltransferase [Mucilaginibacter sp. SG538B]NVM66607.1 DNA adenine methylase [Mucilaginibacter sp. SG538B]
MSIQKENFRFLRYPGGKTKLLSYLSEFLPKNIEGKYIEPFVGGGAVYMFLSPEKALLADLNSDLIDLYRGIKNYPHKVWETYYTFPAGKSGYYKIRNEKDIKAPLYYRAAKTLYLNRTCFKGMWRHNLQGDFNVGYGGEERRWVISHKNLIDLSKLLRKSEITSADFHKTLANVATGDFIFLDPPYKPGEKEMDHAHYINGRFTFEEQKRLADRLKEVSANHDIKWLMTNSSHPSIRDLYQDFTIRTIPKGTSNIVGVFSENSNEVLISNY